MTKRVAQHQMTKENCLNEDEQEEPGLFEQAASGKLLNRNIRKAKRRLPEGKNGIPSSPFSQFAGFVGSKAASVPMFNFGTSQPTSNGKNPNPSPTDNTAKTSLPKPTLFSDTFSQKKNSSASLESSGSERSKPTIVKENEQPAGGGKSENTYLEKLKELNVCFLNWVQEHMNKNAYCDFTPVCVDYIDHMKKLERPAPDKTVNLSSIETTKNTGVPSQPISSSLKKTSPKKESGSPQKKPSVNFSFFAKKDDQSTVQDTQPKPFTFSAGVVSKTASTDKQEKEADGEDNYVPPKNEFQEVKEENALYSKRCKLFYKKEGNFVDKGIGTLYIKKLEEKIQLLVRADTSLGNILLNILLSSSLPTERVGKNNVLIVCVPSPPLDPKATPEPTPLLFRVKTTADADELLEKLNHFKSSTQC